ncbi:MAG: YbbR-like domain-containing protein [Spirochaetes bacterium]|nr:YbbR-like domain-containing protein [Spirochaetota bacterium]
MKKFNKEHVVKDLKVKIFEDFSIKIICFLLAILMYILTSLFFHRTTHTYSSPLKVENLKNYYVLRNKLPENIKIIASDKPSSFSSITEEDFNVRLDLEKIDRPDTYMIPVQWKIPTSMRSLFGYIKVEPRIIEVQVELIKEKNVKIDENTIGKPSPGYAVNKITIDPPYLRIQGPESLINSINSIKTELINIEGIKESFVRTVDCISDYSTVKILGRANISIEIIEETDIVSLKFNKIMFINLAKQFIAKTQDEITVTFKGPKNQATNLKPENVTLYIDCGSIKFPGEYTYDVNVRKPLDFNIISINPSSIKITVEDKSD